MRSDEDMSHETLALAPPRWLGVARAAWVLVVVVELGVFAASVPAYWVQLNTLCADPPRGTCNFTQLTPAMRDVLGSLGLTTAEYAGYTLAIHVVASLALLVVGGLIFWHRSDGWYGLFVSLLLITFGTIGPSSVLSNALEQAYPGIAGPFGLVTYLVFPGLGLFLVTFPDGRFVPKWSIIVVLLWVLQAIFFETIDALPPPLFAAELLLVFGSTLAVQVYRYLCVSDAEQRLQTKWVLFGFALAVSTIIVEVLLNLAFPGYGALGSRLLEGTWVALLFTPIPLSIGIAVLKYRLWDIDPIINRTLVYGALTAIVIATYVLVVVYLGAVFRTGGNLAISLVATGVIAVLFAPLRDRLQGAVNRLMYGERDDPYGVLSRLGQRLRATDAPEAVLPTIVEVVVGALKLPHAAIALKQEDGAFETVAERGRPGAGEPLVLPLSYGTETIGRLTLSPRAPGEPFDRSDRNLLDALARHAETAAYAVRLTADLQRSRERLVNAREEERRRLRRDLHDGLGPQLAALTVKLDAARNLLGTQQPQAADALLAGLKAEAKVAISEVRRLVYDLRPPALDELGLIPAIREQATGYGQNGLEISVEAPKVLPALPAAVEVAAYRITQEAITNVVRHARARACRIRLSVGRELELEITDDGVGLPENRRAGVGLYSMRERAAELGGTCAVETISGGGTRVIAHLPLPATGRSARGETLKADA